MKAKVKVEVNPNSVYGASGLAEIHGLKEGDIIVGEVRNNAIQFKWNGQDAVLFIGENCKPYKGKRKPINEL